MDGTGRERFDNTIEIEVKGFVDKGRFSEYNISC